MDPGAPLLAVMADQLDAYRQRVSDMVPTAGVQGRDELMVALVEVERSLRSADRALRRAIRLAE
jgi:hypothetical protein